MKRTLTLATALLIAGALVAGSAVAATQRNARGACPRSHLTDEQQASLQALDERLRTEQADRATCRAEHERLFANWGLDPATWGPGPGGPGRGGHDGLMRRLTPAQRREYFELNERLLEEKADPGRVREERRTLLESFGVEPPRRGPGAGRCLGGPKGARGGGPDGLMRRLTPAQRRELFELNERLLEERADPRRSRREHRALMKSFGIELPAGPPSDEDIGQDGPDDEKRGGLSGESAQGPDQPVLRGNQPNPFNPETVIHYRVPKAGAVRLEVYDLEGRLVRRLVDAEQSAGEHQATWSGDVQDGAPAASGTYITRLTTSAGSASSRMTLLR